MAISLFVRRTCSLLALALLATHGFVAAPAALTSPSPATNQDTASAASGEHPEAEGDLDPAFGRGGVTSTDFFGNADAAYSVAIQSDAKIVVAGMILPYIILSSSDFVFAP